MRTEYRHYVTPGTVTEEPSPMSTEKNPLEDLRALRDVKMVAIKGQLIEHPVINRYEKVERELNKFL